MHAVLEKLGALGVIPVVTIEDASDAVSLAAALRDGGLPCAEITFRTAAAREAMKNISRAFPDMILGAGTVLSTDQASEAVASGARFIVAPGLNPTVVEFCLQREIPVTPGIATPTELDRALNLGLEVVKFFPAETHGGVPYLQAIAAPFKGARFIPTGGIDATNLLSYLRLPQVLACGGSWMVKTELIRKKQFEKIRQLSAEAILIASTRPGKGE